MDNNLFAWQFITLYDKLPFRLKQADEELPEAIRNLATGTSEYEQKIREAWNEFKKNPTKANAHKFIDFLKELAGIYWEVTLINMLGIDELPDTHKEKLEQYLNENIGYMENSLLPDIIEAIDNEILDSLDYRTTFLYAGALWMFGNIAMVLFDGEDLRNLTDLFLFEGPNDEATCTGPRGCAQHVGKVYTVAEILARNIIPGRLKCVTNCRHMLVSVDNPLVS